MPCHNPLQAWRPRKGRQLVFNKNEGWKDRPVEIPCGQCIGCRLDRSLMWAVRISNELTLHDQASFLTLTYKDLPPNNSINKEDLQAFFKRLRFHLEPKKIRYYACGEYGTKTLRPHYHVCLFGWFPEDAKAYKTTEDGHPLWTSKILEDIWGHGFCVVGQLTFETAAYTARYVTKKITGDSAQNITVIVHRSLRSLSRRPGIGRDWAEKYSTEIKANANIYVRGQTFPFLSTTKSSKHDV